MTPDTATNKAVTWSSSNNNMATVDTDGNVTAIAAGDVTITARSVSNTDVTAACAVTITTVTTAVPVTSVAINESNVTLQVGGKGAFSATVSPSNASVKAVTWSSNNSAAAIVDSDGNVTAMGVGTATITVTTVDGGKTDYRTVTVNYVAVTGVVLNKTTTTISLNGIERLFATINPDNATDKGITWSTSNTNVATVASDGTVTGKAAGTATITATSSADSTKSASCDVTVTATTVSVSGVTLNHVSITIKAGNTTTLTPTITPDTASNKNVSWSSNNTAVATVANGVVTGIKGGTAAITVTTADGGRTATCTVTVEDNAAVTFEWAETGISLTPSPSILTISQGGAVTITAPSGLGSYAWYVDGKIVNGEISNVFIFDSTGKAKGNYSISLWAGNSVGGDAIKIIVQ